MDDDFKVVVRPKRRQKFAKSKSLQAHQVQPAFEEGTQEFEATNLPSLESILKTLRNCCEEIKPTSFYKTFKDLLFVKMHHVSMCSQHPSSSNCSDRSISKSPFPTDSASDIQKSLSVPTERGENPLDTFKQNPSIDVNLQLVKTQTSNEHQEVISRMKNAQSSDTLFLFSETDSNRFHPQANAHPDYSKMATNLELVIYGIGNFASCLIARYQLALMLALRDTLKLPCSSVQVFDPKLFSIEKSAIKELGLSLISHNEEGKRPVTDRCWTLFFMPHCGKALCNNLLWANWSPGQLSNMIIIGNSFSSLVERNPERLLKQYYYYIWKIRSVTEETSLPNSFKHSDIFNDTSIHCFHLADMSKLPSDFWGEHTEPVYDSSDLEIIVNK